MHERERATEQRRAKRARARNGSGHFMRGIHSAKEKAKVFSSAQAETFCVGVLSVCVRVPICVNVCACVSVSVASIRVPIAHTFRVSHPDSSTVFEPVHRTFTFGH